MSLVRPKEVAKKAGIIHPGVTVGMAFVTRDRWPDGRRVIGIFRFLLSPAEYVRYTKSEYCNFKSVDEAMRRYPEEVLSAIATHLDRGSHAHEFTLSSDDADCMRNLFREPPP